MKLSDIMSNAGLSGWAEVALVLFLVAFVAILFRVFSKRRSEVYEHVSRLPLDEDESHQNVPDLSTSTGKQR